MRTDGFSDQTFPEVELVGDFLRIVTGDIPCPNIERERSAMRRFGRIPKPLFILNGIINLLPLKPQLFLPGNLIFRKRGKSIYSLHVSVLVSTSPDSVFRFGQKLWRLDLDFLGSSLANAGEEDLELTKI